MRSRCSMKCQLASLILFPHFVEPSCKILQCTNIICTATTHRDMGTLHKSINKHEKEKTQHKKMLCLVAEKTHGKCIAYLTSKVFIIWHRRLTLVKLFDLVEVRETKTT